MSKIAFIGAGNMNSAIILGLLNSGMNAKDIIVANPSPAKREAWYSPNR
jgi:pyrroline-5-carboxylate reductase